MKIIIKKNINKEDIDNSNKIFDEKKINYKLSKKNWNYPKSKQFIIYLNKNNINVGMIRVIKKKIYLYKKFYNVACLASVGIFPNYRKLGYGKILMKKSNNYLKKKFDISFLIARRKLIFFILNLILLAILNFCQLSLNSKKK